MKFTDEFKSFFKRYLLGAMGIAYVLFSIAGLVLLIFGDKTLCLFEILPWFWEVFLSMIVYFCCFFMGVYTLELAIYKQLTID